MREEAVTSQVDEILISIVLPIADTAWMIAELEREQTADEAGAAEEHDRLIASISDIEHKLERLADLYLAGGVKMDEYATLRNRLIEDKHRLREQIEAME